MTGSKCRWLAIITISTSGLVCQTEEGALGTDAEAFRNAGASPHCGDSDGACPPSLTSCEMDAERCRTDVLASVCPHDTIACEAALATCDAIEDNCSDPPPVTCTREVEGCFAAAEDFCAAFPSGCQAYLQACTMSAGDCWTAQGVSCQEQSSLCYARAGWFCRRFPDSCRAFADECFEMVVGCDDPHVPEGWSGPAVVVDGAFGEAPPCPQGFAEDRVAFAGLGGDPLGCECACGDIEGGGCDGQQLLMTYDTTFDCDAPEDQRLVPLDTCVETANGLAASTGFFSLHVTQGACPPIALHDHPEPTWASEHRVCTRPSGFQSGGDGPLCILREGDHSCPAAYPQRHLRYTAYTDDRACGECMCSFPLGHCELHNTYFFASACDTPQQSITVTSDVCIGMSDHLLVTAGEPQGQCYPYDDDPTGELTPSGELTFCCAV